MDAAWRFDHPLARAKGQNDVESKETLLYLVILVACGIAFGIPFYFFSSDAGEVYAPGRLIPNTGKASATPTRETANDDSLAPTATRTPVATNAAILSVTAALTNTPLPTITLPWTSTPGALLDYDEPESVIRSKGGGSSAAGATSAPASPVPTQPPATKPSRSTPQPPSTNPTPNNPPIIPPILRTILPPLF